MTDSRAKGARGEREFIEVHLARHWPEAKRNLDQFGEDKRDVVFVAGLHVQIKRTERLQMWAAIHQAESEAIGGAIPVVAFRRNRSSWHIIAPADIFLDLWALHAGCL